MQLLLFCFFPLNNVTSEVLLYLLQLAAQQHSINASKGCTYLLEQCGLSYVSQGKWKTVALIKVEHERLFQDCIPMPGMAFISVARKHVFHLSWWWMVWSWAVRVSLVTAPYICPLFVSLPRKCVSSTCEPVSSTPSHHHTLKTNKVNN